MRTDRFGRRRQATWAALLLVAATTADARAGATGPEPAASAQAEPGWTTVPLDALGLDAYARRKWRSPTLTLRYRTRLDRVVTAARLRLQLTAARIDGLTGLRVVVNGVRVAELPADELRPAEAPREIAIDPRLVTADNDVTLTVQTSRTSSCVAAGGWSLIAPGSTLEVRLAEVHGQTDLRWLPLPFVDPRLDARAEIPFVFAVAPSPAALRAALLVAGAFALAAPARLSFPVHVGRLPAGNAVVIGTAAGLAALGVDEGPVLGVVERPGGHGRLLVLRARDEELPALALRLADSLAGRAPPAELALGRQVAFADLVAREQLTLRGRGDGQIRVPFVLPPATVFWPASGVPVKLIWEDSHARDAPSARLVLTLNGHYVTTLQHAWSVHAPGAHEARFRLPQAYLRRENELTLSREAEPTDACPAKHDDELVRVLGDSTLDLRGGTEFALLPDLGQLVAGGFPFTRARDLGGTTIVVPRAPAPRTLSTLLALAAELARAGGAVARGAELADGDELPATLDRDLVVVGTAREQPLLARWRDRLPPSPARGGFVVELESPLHRGRTALVLTADDEAAMPDVELLAASPLLDQERHDVAMIADGKIVGRGFGHSYGVGRLSPLRRGLWFLSQRIYLLLLLLVAGGWWLTRLAFGAASRRARRRLTLLVLLLSLMPRSARADEVPASVLEARALFWERSGRCDKAVEVWQQLARLAPGSAPAQQGLSRCRTAAAPAVDESKERAVAAARALAHAGRYDEAVAAYDKLFGGAPPEAYALEYDETLAGTRARRSEAQARLAALAARHGDAPEYALAYARALAYGEPTRRAAIARLERLAAVPAVAAKAEATWRSALLWLEAGAADRPLFARYLAQHPEDRELQQRLGALARTSTLGAALELGYARLNGGALDDASESFARVLLASPNDVHALVGMSWVRLKQARFAEARSLAEEARRRAPAAASLWRPPLQAALLWSTLDEADAAEKRRDFAAAEAALQRAAALSPRDGTLVALRRGRLFLAEGRAAAAEALLRPLVPAQPDALPLLVEALLSQGKTDEAAAAERELPSGNDPADPTRRRLRMAIARARARAAAARGDNATALQQLRQALELDPSDRDTRLELVYRELDVPAPSAALAVAEALHRERGDDPEVVTALALAEVDNDDEAAALATLKSIDAARLTADGRALEERLALAARVRQVLDHSRNERQLTARLGELERDHETRPELLAVVAAAWWKAGQHERALATVRKVLAQAPSRSARLRCAGILLDAGSAGASELSRLLDDLGAEPQLSPREQREIDAIRRTQLIHLVDGDRRAGEYKRAFLRLQAALEAAPDATPLLSALARLQASAGHAAKALATYQLLIARDPTDLALTEGAAFAAVAAGEMARARQLAAAALAHHADDPRAFLLAGRIALLRHDDRLGHHLLALGLERVRPQPDKKPDGDVQLAAARALVADARQELAGDEPAPDEEEPPTDEALREEMSRLELRYAPTAGAGVSFRFRSGDPGLARLFEVDVPLSLQMSPGPGWGRFTAAGVPVYLTSQATDLTNPAIADAFGTDGINTPTTLPLRLSNDVWGFALALRYQYRDLLLELGSTPIGFRIVDVIGQAGWEGRFGAWTLGVRGFRNAVTDSVLSYSGLRDANSGIVWGGVRREGGAVDVNFDPGAYVLHLSVSYAAFTGKRVATNHGGAYDLSALWRLYRRPRQTVALGLDAFVMNYAYDLRYFSLGQGGYFSPQFFLLVGLPMTWVAHGDAWTLTAGGEAGVNYYTEDPSPIFPADGDLQAIRQAQPDLGTQLHGAFYPGVEKVNAYGKVHLDVQVDLGGHFALDTAFDGEFSSAYSQIVFSLGLHKAFPR